MLGVLLRRPQQRTLADHARYVTRRCNNDSLAVEYLALALVYAVCPVHAANLNHWLRECKGKLHT